MKKDSWGRYVRPEPEPDPRYQQQLELQLNKTVDATPEEAAAWQKNELDWWGDKQLMFVAIASLVQVSALGFMLTCFYLIDMFAGH